MENLGPISLFPKTSYKSFFFFYWLYQNEQNEGDGGNRIPNIIPNVRELGESQ